MSPSSSSSYQAQEPPPPGSELWWDRLPSLKIVRPPKGPFSPKVDERCFTYCSQSITGRINGADPWCRSICFRRVFSHEVVRVLAHHRSQSLTHIPGATKPVLRTTEHLETAPINHPLPPEGQRYSSWLTFLLGDRFSSHPDDALHPDPTPSVSHAHSATHDQRYPRYWQEGWYLWWSTSRWAAQEKLDLMRKDLQAQSEWQRFKDKRNDEWARGLPFDHDAPSPDSQGQNHDPNPFEDLGNLPPFPDITAHTLLLPLPTIPTSFPALYTTLSAQIAPALAPTATLLTLVQDSIQSGAQRELLGRMWDKALSDEPRKLLVVAWARVRDNLFGSDDDDGSGPGSSSNPGSGSGSKDTK